MSTAGTTGEDRRLRGLHAAWASPPGWRGRLAAVNHSTIGLRFVVTGLAFFLVGGLLAMFMRLQLAWSGNEVLDPQRYAEFTTMHGTTMMFLFAVPVMEGFALYLVPKMIGARDLPFPRLSAFGYWCYLFGGLFLYSSFLFDAVPDSGWFMYVPLTDATWSPGLNADFWLIGVTFSEIAAVAAAVEMIVAILIGRAPGMDLRRIPLFAWAMLVTSFMIVFGFPPLILASVLLELQRAFGFVFFDPALGGDPLLWQHLFWLFGHPEVYIIFLPAAGVVSMVVSTFARRPMVGYTWIVLALVGTGFLSFGLWVHHMFTVGIPLLALAFFSAASMAVAIPMGIQVFAWIATLWAGRPWLRVPALYLFGFFFVFVPGGLTGIMVAMVPFDWQAHDSHFVVAHLHHVLIGGLMFPLFAGLYYWLPLASGREPSESLSRTAFWLVFTGFNLTFLPMYFTGLMGMPRRAWTYLPELGLHWPNLVSTAAGFLLAVGMVAVLVDVALAFRHGARARRNPWQAGTLEWALGHPVPNFNFASIPRVQGRDPLWADPLLADASARPGGLLGHADHGRRELLGTSLLDARVEQVIRISGPSALPLLAALALAAVLAAFIAKLYLLSAALGLPLLALLWRWAWTTGDPGGPDAVEAAPAVRLPTQGAARNAPGWWALVMALLVDGSLFASLVFSYFYLWLGTAAWPPAGLGLATWPAAITALVLLLACAGSTHLAQRALQRGDPGRAALAWIATAALGPAFVAAQAWAMAPGGAPARHAYSAVAWTLAGFHVVHVLLGLLFAAFVAARLRRGLVTTARPLEARVAAGLWRYIVGQGLVAWAVLHLFPRLA